MLVDLCPLRRGADATEIRVAGVRIGDPAARIDRAAITAPEEDERVEVTLRSGGTVRCGEVALCVQDGVVESIVVRGPSLMSLDITAEATIARAFGPATGHDRVGRCRIHHYSNRRIAIGWDERAGCVEHVHLGVPAWREPRLGAPELLAELLAAYGVLSERDWAEPEPSYRSARVRYQRIAALARALGLGSPDALVRGEFFRDAQPIDAGRRRIIEEIASLSEGASFPVRFEIAPFLFAQLLDYRHRVERLVRSSSRYLICSDPVLSGMIVAQGRIGAGLRTLVADVDRWLCGLMDPAGRTFERRELIAQYGYPDVDLEQLEIDEL